MAAIEEERISRVKQANVFPHGAILACLEQGQVGWEDVDAIAVTLSESYLSHVARAVLLQDAAAPLLPSGLALIGELFTRAFGIEVTDRLRCCSHHEAHLWSAFVPSGFDESCARGHLRRLQVA